MYTQSHKTNLGIKGKLEPMLLILLRWNSVGGCLGSVAWTMTTMKMMKMIMTMMATVTVAAQTLGVSNLHGERSSKKDRRTATGHSGEYGNGAKLVGKMSKSVMQLISIHF